MTILLPALATAFPAFCVWLTVRIVNRHERWAKCMLAAVIGVPVLYVASFGPACWLTSGPAREVPVIYRPITLVADSSKAIRSAVFWYATLQSRPGCAMIWTQAGDDPGRWAWGDPQWTEVEADPEMNLDPSEEFQMKPKFKLKSRDSSGNN
jgi:hypothetical protein